MIDLEIVQLCAGCQSDLATTQTEAGTRVCATCFADWQAYRKPAPVPLGEQQSRLWAWASEQGYPRLELYPYLAIAEGERYWRVFVDHPANAEFWPVALERIGA